MNRIIFSLKYILGACILTLLGGCYDDTFGYLNGDMADGEVTVSLDACFEPFGEADLTRTMSGGTPGHCMKGLDDLCLLLYDSEGKLVEGFPREITGYDVSDEDRTEGDGAYTGHPIAEASTKHARFTTSIPAGAYYMVAVANLGYGNYKSTYQALVSGKYANQYTTLHDLRMMKIAWDSENVANNRAMLGYFDGEKSSNPNEGSSFPLIQISSNTRLKAWLRRCVSKITVDIDGSALRDNVYVFIKDVKVKNLVKECNLGFGKLMPQSGNPIIYNNAASKEDELLDDKLNEQVITFGEGEDFNQWPLITNGTPYITEEVLPGQTADGKAAKPRLNLHTETSPALFFFENMQGNSPYPKVSTADPSNNGRPTGSGNRDYDCDGLPCGTYIEVTAHYRSMNYDNVGEGEIKYRFMIGKDAIKNCDAERNSHFKLTLKLRGNANNYEWHVDYKDSEGFDAPNPWYVSYLYNHSSQLPFKYTPPKGWKVVKMEATIIDNPWYPTPNADGSAVYPAGDDPSPYSNTNNRYNGNGFLALHSPMSERQTTMKDGKIVTVEDIGNPWPGYKESAKDYNDAFFYGKAAKSSIDKSHRVYNFDDATQDDTNTGIESYSYKKERDQFLDVDKYTFSIPLFTREKVLIKRTGYSGNNPFEPYTRTAKLKLTATIENEETGERESVDKVIDVVQVKRLVNPKGVYREKGHNQDFHVILMERDGLDDKKFHETISDGPWRAEIIGDQGFITLDGKQTVSGPTRTAIDFNIKFNKTNSKNSPNKYAIVRVLYNNYTCTHLIFVRQGYDEEELSPSAINKFGTVANPAKWSPFNMIAEGVPATDPRDEGSLFRYGNLTQPIDAINNVYKDDDGDGDGDVLLQSVNDFVVQGPFKIAGTKKVLDDGSAEWTTLSWENITHNSTGFGDDSGVAGVHDFEQLYLTPFIQFGYGVLYADGATETKDDVLEVFGYNRYAPNTAVRGMRGVFAYFYNANEPKEKMTGRNLFFPIGRSAYGHRKNKNDIVAGKGILRYSSSNKEARSSVFSDSAPLFSSLYRREGAIYWAATPVIFPDYLTWNGQPDDEGYDAKGNPKPVSDRPYAYALDLNFFSFDVNTISGTNVADGADACFVRCVK